MNTQETKVEDTLLDLDTIEGMDFDAIEDAPGFVQPPNGVYDLRVEKACIEKYKTKEGDERQRFAHYYIIDNVVELEDAAEQAPKNGDKFSERFMCNAQGISYWKTKAKSILGDIGPGMTVPNVLKELTGGGYAFRARITNKKTKGKTDGKEYTNANVRVIAKAGDVPGLEGAETAA